MAALRELLLLWVADAPAAAAGAAGGSSGKRGSGSAGGEAAAAGSSSSNSSGIALAVELLAREQALLQAAAASPPVRPRASSSSAAPPPSPPRSPRWQQQWREPGSGDGEDEEVAAQLPEGALAWGGDVAACVAAVLAAVGGCTSTNQWAKLEQLADSAAAALAAAAAVHQQQQPQGQQQGQQQQRQSPRQRQQQGSSWQEWDGDDDGAGSQRSGGDATPRAAADSRRRQQLDAVRQSLGSHALSDADAQALQQQLAQLRGRVRAARLLTKHGCCVALGDLAAADSAAVDGMLQRLLGRAQRCVAAVGCRVGLAATAPACLCAQRHCM